MYAEHNSGYQQRKDLRALAPFFWDPTAQTHSKRLDEEHPLYLAVDPIGFLSSAAEQSPSFVLDIADVDVVAVALPEGDPGAPEHEEVVAM